MKLVLFSLLALAPAFATTCGVPGGPAVDLSTPVINDDLYVPAGATCKLHYVNVMGNTTVEGALVSFASHFSKNVNVTGAIGFINYYYDNAAVDGNLIITATTGDSGFWVGDAKTVVIRGNLIVSDSTARFYSEGVNVLGNAIFDNNKAGVILGGNTFIGKNLNCDDNTPAPVLGNITATYKNGQCSGF
jgi:hypothetical protein